MHSYNNDVVLTGINKYKMVIVNVPKDSSYPSVSITFAGLYGTIAGMSSMGLTGVNYNYYSTCSCTHAYSGI